MGEPAADAEGFSGMDGRTTIFDYWSVPSLRRWHQGKPTTHERKLRTAYRRIMRMAATQPTLANGAFFDLMYVNQDTLDTWQQYAYLRHHEGQMTLIVVNFGDTAVHTAVRLPSHAFVCAHLTNGTYSCKELLTGENGLTTFNGQDASFDVQVPPHGAAIWHFDKTKD